MMCPVIFLALGLSFLLLLLELSAAISVTFSPTRVEELKEGEECLVHFSINDTDANEGRYYEFAPSDPSIAKIVNNASFTWNSTMHEHEELLNGTFLLRGLFLGYTEIRLKTNDEESSEESLFVSVIRKKGWLSKAFIISVIVLLSLNYINMGCALDLSVVKSVLIKPVAPALGFASQYVAMPLISFGLAKLLFNQPIMQLGLFTFGCSPGGGASNIWTVVLKGNLNLSLTMTFISTLAAMGMIPLWLFTLGTTLFEGTRSKVPFVTIVTTLVSIVIPLGIGLLFQRFLPRVAKFCRKMLALASVLTILFIVTFGTYANLYMFRLITWQVMVAAISNVWLGFFFGCLSSKLIGLPTEDIIAISIETGVQNTGIAIVLLGISLSQLDSDLASVVPVAGSIVTPFPLLIFYLIHKFCTWKKSRKDEVQDLILDDAQVSMLKSPSETSGASEMKPITNGHM